MRNTLKGGTLLLAIILATTALPAVALEGGLDPRDGFHVSSDYGEAWGAVTWESDTLAWIDLNVADTRYDGWCAVLVTDAVNVGMTIAHDACGVGTSQGGNVNPSSVPGTDLHTIEFTICGYYPPHDVWDCGEADTLHNPLA